MVNSMHASFLVGSDSTTDMVLKTIDKALSIGKDMILFASYCITGQPFGEKIQNFEGGLENTSCSRPREMILPSVTNALSELELYAHGERIEDFISLSKNINWSEQPPYALSRAIDLALALDLSSLAVGLAQRGETLFPDNVRLQKAAKVLCGSNIQRTQTTTSGRQLHDSRKWLQDYAGQYKGKWVAVQSGELLGVADTLKEVQRTIGASFHSRDTVITKIL
ncbi:MAG: DUF5678 domain-containing protein [Candidatus Hodarchaeota archaeon]